MSVLKFQSLKLCSNRRSVFFVLEVFYIIDHLDIKYILNIRLEVNEDQVDQDDHEDQVDHENQDDLDDERARWASCNFLPALKFFLCDGKSVAAGTRIVISLLFLKITNLF